MAKSKWQKVRNKHGRGGKVVGTVVRNTKTKKEKTLLNPHGKYVKYSEELNAGVRFTNNGQQKVNRETGEVSKLTKEQKAYRAGYRSAIIDQTKAFKAGK